MIGHDKVTGRNPNGLGLIIQSLGFDEYDSIIPLM